MKRLLLTLLAALALPTAVNAFWGSSEEEKTICRDRASREKNEFSAKQTYNYCSKNIKSELKEKERKSKEREKYYQRWYGEVGKEKESECKKLKEILDNMAYEYNTLLAESVAEMDYWMCKGDLLETKRKYGL